MRHHFATSIVFAFVFIQIAAAQTTQPTQPGSDDLWTNKRLTDEWGGVRTMLENAGFKLELYYQQQYQQNFRGGLDTHHAERLSGSYDLGTELDFEKMKLIKGGSFYIRAQGGYSEGINPKVGALGNVNADAFKNISIFVRKWWYKQEFLDDKIEFRIGRLQTNKNLFDVGFYAYNEDKDFLNQSIIRNQTIPHTTGLGAFLKVQPVNWAYFQAAAVDAQAVSKTKSGFDTAFQDEAWYLGLWELGLTPTWSSPKGPMPGSYRIGWWFDPRVKTEFENTHDGQHHPGRRGDDLGLYLGFDQLIWKENNRPKDQQGLGVFSRFGVAQRDIDKISHYWSVGPSYKGLIPTRDEDVTALAVAQSILSSQYRQELHPVTDRETAYEWYYQIQVTPWCTITPDFQVVTNTGGDTGDRDATIGGLRLRIIF